MKSLVHILLTLVSVVAAIVSVVLAYSANQAAREANRLSAEANEIAREANEVAELGARGDVVLLLGPERPEVYRATCRFEEGVYTVWSTGTITVTVANTGSDPVSILETSLAIDAASSWGGAARVYGWSEGVYQALPVQLSPGYRQEWGFIFLHNTNFSSANKLRESEALPSFPVLTLKVSLDDGSIATWHKPFLYRSDLKIASAPDCRSDEFTTGLLDLGKWANGPRSGQ